jgi:hypothetical protein
VPVDVFNVRMKVRKGNFSSFNAINALRRAVGNEHVKDHLMQADTKILF